MECGSNLSNLNAMLKMMQNTVSLWAKKVISALKSTNQVFLQIFHYIPCAQKYPPMEIGGNSIERTKD